MANSSSNVLAAFLGGAILGSIAALLLTPKTGKELREDIASMAEKAGREMSQACRCNGKCNCDEKETTVNQEEL